METNESNTMKILNEELLQKLVQLSEDGKQSENKAKTALLYALYLWNQHQYSKIQKENQVSQESQTEPDKLEAEKEKEIRSSLVGTAYYYIKNKFTEVFKYLFMYENYAVIDEACKCVHEILKGHKTTIITTEKKNDKIDLGFGWDDVRLNEEEDKAKAVVLFLMSYEKSYAWGLLARNFKNEKEFSSALLLAEWIKFSHVENVRKWCYKYFLWKPYKGDEKDKDEIKSRKFAVNFVVNNCWLFEKGLKEQDYKKAGSSAESTPIADYFAMFIDYAHFVNGFASLSEEVLGRYISLALADTDGKYKALQYEIAIQVSDVATLLRLLEENGLGESQKEELAGELRKKIDKQPVSRILTDKNVSYAIALDEEALSCGIFDAYIRSDADLWTEIGEAVSREKQEEFYALVCRLRIGEKASRCSAVRDTEMFLAGCSEATQTALRNRLTKEMLLLNEPDEVKEMAEKTGKTALLACATAWEKYNSDEEATLSEIVTLFEDILRKEEYEVINQCGMLLSKWLTNDCNKPDLKVVMKRSDIAYLSKEGVYGYFFANFMDPDGSDLLSKFYFEKKNNPFRDAVNLMEKIKFPDDSNVDEFAYTNVKRSLERTANNNVAPNFLVNNAYLFPLIEDTSYVAELLYQIKRNKSFQGASVRTVEKYFEYFCKVSEKSAFEEEMLTYIAGYVYEILRQTVTTEAFRSKCAMELLEEMFRPGCRLERSLLLTEEVNGETSYVHSSKLIFFLEKYYESGLNDRPESKMKALVEQIRREWLYEKDRIAYDWLKKIIEGHLGQDSDAFVNVSKLVFSFYPNCDTDKICDAIDTQYLRRDHDVSFWDLLELLNCVLSENIQLQKRIYRYIVNKVSLGSEAEEKVVALLEKVLRCEKETRYTEGLSLDKSRLEKSVFAARYLVAVNGEETDMDRLFDEMTEKAKEEAAYICALRTLHEEKSLDEVDTNRAWKKNIVFCGITNYWDSFIEAFGKEDEEEVRMAIKNALERYLPAINEAPFFRRVLQNLVYSIQALADKKVGSIDKADSKKKVVHAAVSENQKKGDEEIIGEYNRILLLCELNPYLKLISRKEGFYKDSNVRLKVDYVLKHSHVDIFLNGSKKELTEKTTEGLDALCLAVLALFTKKQCVALMDGVCSKKTNSDTVDILVEMLKNKMFRTALLDGICEFIGEKQEEKKDLERFVIQYYQACACLRRGEAERGKEVFATIDKAEVPGEYRYHYGVLEDVLVKEEGKHLVGLEYKGAEPYSNYKMSFAVPEKSPDSMNKFDGLVKQFRSKDITEEEKCQIARKIFYGLLLCKKTFDKRKGYFDQDFFLEWTLAEINRTPEKRYSYLYELLQISQELLDMGLRNAVSDELREQDENLIKLDERKTYGKASSMKTFYGTIRERYLELLEKNPVGIVRDKAGDRICVWDLEKSEQTAPWNVAQSLMWVSEHVLKEERLKKKEQKAPEDYDNYIRLCAVYELMKNNKVETLKKRFEEESKEGTLVDKRVTEFGFYKECKKKVELYTKKEPLSVRIINAAEDTSADVFYEIIRSTEMITDNLTILFSVDGKLVPVKVNKKAFSDGNVFYGVHPMEHKKGVRVEGVYYGAVPYTKGAAYTNLRERVAISGTVSEKAEQADVTPCVKNILTELQNGYHVVFDNRGNSNKYINELVTELKKGIQVKGNLFQKEWEENADAILSENGTRKIVVLRKFSGKMDLSEETNDLYVIDHRSLPVEKDKLRNVLREDMGFSEDNCQLVTGEQDLFSKYSRRVEDYEERKLTKEAKGYMEKKIALLPGDGRAEALERWINEVYKAIAKAGRTHIYPTDAETYLPVLPNSNNTGLVVHGNVVNGDWKPTQIGELKIKNEVKNEVYFYTQVINNLVQVNIENTFNFSITKEMEKWYDFSESGTVESEDAALKKYEEKLKERLKELQIKKEEFTNQMRVLRDNGQETTETYTELQEALKRIEKEEDEINGKLTNAETLENSFEEDLTRMFEERQKTEGREPLTDQEIWEFLGMDEASYEELKIVLDLSDIGQKDFNRKFVNAVYTQKEIAERPEIAGYDKDYSAAASGYGIIVEGMLKRLHKEIYDKRFCTTDSMYTNNYWRRWWSKSGELMLGSFIFHLDNSGTYSLNDITINKITDDRSVSRPNGGNVAAMRTAVQEEWWHSLDTKQNRSGSYQVIKNRLDGLSFSGAAPECQVSVTVNGTVKQRTTCNGCMHKNECQVHKAWKEHYETMKVVHSCRNDGSHDDDNITDIVIVTPQRMEELVKALFRKSPKDGLFGYQRIRRLNQYANGNYGEGEQPVAVTKGMGLTETVLNNYKNTGTKVLFWCTVSAGPNNEKGEIRGKEGETSAHVTNVRVISKSASFTGNLVQWKHYAATIRNVNGTTVDVEVEDPATECVFTCTRRQQDGAKWFGTISWNGMELNAAAIAYASDAANGVMQEQNPENKSYKAELCGEERGKPIIKVKLLSEL